MPRTRRSPVPALRSRRATSDASSGDRQDVRLRWWCLFLPCSSALTVREREDRFKLAPSLDVASVTKRHSTDKERAPDKLVRLVEGSEPRRDEEVSGTRDRAAHPLARRRSPSAQPDGPGCPGIGKADDATALSVSYPVKGRTG